MQVYTAANFGADAVAHNVPLLATAAVVKTFQTHDPFTEWAHIRFTKDAYEWKAGYETTASTCATTAEQAYLALWHTVLLWAPGFSRCNPECCKICVYNMTPQSKLDEHEEHMKAIRAALSKMCTQ